MSTYVVGTPVTGSQFYNRDEILKELLQFDRRNFFLIGMRRIGKTSILRQLRERLLVESDFFPIYCDLKGLYSDEEMGRNLLLEIEDLIREKFLNEDFKVTNVTLVDTLDTWAKYCKKHHYKSFLLFDEAEQFREISHKNLQNLERIIDNASENIKIILAGTRTAFHLEENKPSFASFTSLFTRRFVGQLGLSDSKNLILQKQEPAADDLNFFENQIEIICSSCGGHPYLIQFVCDNILNNKQVYKSKSGQGELLALESISSLYKDEGLALIFKEDFECLTEEQQKIIKTLAQHLLISEDDLISLTSLDLPTIQNKLTELINWGLIEENDNMYFIRYQLFKDWVYDTQVKINVQKIGAKKGENESPPPFNNKLRIVTIFAQDSYDILTAYKEQCIDPFHEYFEHWDITKFSSGAIKQLYDVEISKADIIVGLLSAGFFAKESETADLFEHVKSHTHFIPVLAQTFYYQELIPPSQYTLHPQKNNKPLPIPEWEHPNTAYSIISELLMKFKKNLHP